MDKKEYWFRYKEATIFKSLLSKAKKADISTDVDVKDLKKRLNQSTQWTNAPIYYEDYALFVNLLNKYFSDDKEYIKEHETYLESISGSERILRELNREDTLAKKVSSKTKSLEIMDIFEDRVNYDYKRIIFENVLTVFDKSDKKCRFNIIVERTPNNPHDVYGNITFTEFKNNKLDYLLSHIANEINNMDKNEIERGKVLLLSKPFEFRAQSSGNRTGYGSEYRNGECVYHGTLYGETCSYYINSILVIW